ncbi:MAG: S8 family serine peptidase, partial [Flavobacteriales bacterium]
NNLTITSKSYSNGTNAGYTSLASQLDQQIRQMPELIHVFSAGNAGSGWSTITGGHKQAKNVMAVANLSYTDGIASSSSRGPAEDGRLKPDISAVGTNVYSTVDPNGYQNLSGTSMACPGVAGVLAQMYHAYKTTHAGTNPNSALIKAAVMNTADDLGNAGPDFIHGWGRINARRAYTLVNNNQYFLGAVAQGANNQHIINVPVGTTQLRVMLYWSDYEGAASASPALVNDMDMVVVDPGATTFNPWVLNPFVPTAVAVQGIDSLNNVEQVTITNPLAGNHTIDITGFSIPQGPQEYFIVYEFIKDEVVVTYPTGREGFNPGTVETIRWDSYGGTGTFLLEYSTDSGSVWTTINAAVNTNLRHFDWVVPVVLSGKVLVRVSRGALTDMSDAVFSIIQTPVNLTIDWACPDSMKLSWSAVTGATQYEISMLGNKYMDSVAVSDTNSYVFYNTNPTLTYWFSVRALGPTNARSERAIALQKAPGIISCPINIDASIASIVPANNTQYLTCLVNVVDVTITLFNSGQTTLNNIPVHYQLNGGIAINEIFAGPLNPGSNASHTFAAPVSPLLGNNQLLVWSDLSGDGNLYNDTVETQFTFIFAPLQNLPWGDDFETFALCGTNNNCALEICPLGNGFMNETNGTADDIDWRTDENGTPTNNTGPDVDFNPGDTTGNYLYLEASNGCNSQMASLVSPCIDLTTETAPGLQFAYHMLGDDMGSLMVDVYSNNTWTNVFIISGDQGPNWIVQQVSLGSFVGTIINIRFRGTTGNGSQSDVAIDDILVEDGMSIADNPSVLNFVIYPNPASGNFTISSSGNDNYSYEVFNSLGEIIRTGSFKQTTILEAANWQAGFYFISVSDGKNSWNQKLVKQ